MRRPVLGALVVGRWLAILSIGCGDRTGLDDAGGARRDAPSCAPGGPGMTNCGGSGAESCCTSLETAGGTYYRTYENAGGVLTAEADPATVTSFRLDKYLVTVGRFRQFVNAVDGAWLPPAGSGKHAHLRGGLGLANSAAPGGYEGGWDVLYDGNIAPTSANLSCDPRYATWTVSAGRNENLPINCTTFYEAYAFCIWDGGFLPSEAEWEYAAAGGSQQRAFAWGSADPGTENRLAIFGCYYPKGVPICDGLLSIAPVGTATAGAGRWGQLDLAGDLWEWTLDWNAAYVDPCVDCAYLTVTNERMARGGGFSGDASGLLPTDRASLPPVGRFSDTSFRCARAP
jgi:sulfatase modifying factor 1